VTGDVSGVAHDDDVSVTIVRHAPETAPEVAAVEPVSPTQASGRAVRRARPRSRGARTRWIRRGVAVAIVVLLVPVAWSYVGALRAPGTDSVGLRTVEWVRHHGGDGLVNTLERWWYTNNPPRVGGRPGAIKAHDIAGTAGLPTAPTPIPTMPATTLPPQAVHLPPPTQPVPTPAAAAEPGEGAWQPTGRLVAGFPAVYTTSVRPDAIHTSYYTGLMWIDTKLLKTVFVAGLQQPGGGPGPWGAQIPEDVRDRVVAAFNGGFQMIHARGGAYVDGNAVQPLRDGAASLVITTDGTATVGAWGRDAVMSPDIAAVRQNLELIVDAGQLNPELRENDTSAFGATVGNNVYVWRSGVGVDPNGALIYAGGPAMSVLSLAKTLQAAGAVRAMELDINSDWVSAYIYISSDPANPASPVRGEKLHENMSRSGDRYLQPSGPDFFVLLGDPKFPPPPAPTTLPPAALPTATTAPRATASTAPRR
jgi:hypothetical protein